MGKTKRITQLSDLTPDTQNANKGTERGRYMVEASLTETGAGRSIVADKDGRIIAGNKTLEAWAGMGGAVKVVETDGHELVVVQRTDLDLSDPKGKARKLAYYDNRAGQVGLEWDAAQLLSDVNAGVDLAAMFKADEIAELLAGVKGGAEADAEPQIDQAEELNKKWQVKPSDLWRIGAHRLLCGDSTKAADVARVMGGERADCVLTDPPYSSGGFQESGKSSGSIGTRSGETIAHDNLSTRGYRLLMDDALRLFGDADALYLFTDWRMWMETFDAAERGGWRVRNMLVWDKQQMGMGMPWRNQHELILFGKRTPAKIMDGKRGNVLQAQRTGNPNHPTEKPVSLIQGILENTDGAICCDPFAGSGTTIVACENLGRKCRAIEISPTYCAVILERMAQAFPKLEITRDDGAN